MSDGVVMAVPDPDSELPAGWAWAKLGELGVWYGGGTPSKRRPEFWKNGTIPWLSPKDMGAETLTSTQDLIHPSALEDSPVKLVPANSVAFVVRSGILERTVPVAYVPFETTLNQDMKAISPHGGIDARWLAWSLRAREQYILRHCRKRGTTVASLETAWLMDTRLAVPPLAEQLRIVDRLEAQVLHIQTGELAARAANSNIPALKNAIRGSLTWPAEALPDDWRWGTIGDVLQDIEAGKSFTCLPRPARPDEWGIIKVSAMTWGEFRETENKAVPREKEFNFAHEIQPGDILVSRANTEDYVGAPVLVESCRPFLLLSDKSLRLKPNEGVEKRWLLHVLSSPQVRAQISSKATGTSDSMRNISQTSLKSVRIPIPTSAEQCRVAALVDSQLEAVSAFERSLPDVVHEAASLRSSLLAAASAGELVPQDPSEESASIIINRIRAQQAAAAPIRKRRTARTRKTTPPNQGELPL
ncbi:restriction endonuclease subunit S [Streptomyces hygroscopicus]|uniref:restriction endonuclease subunit S n=1 Tax=Streptomyces hygroscopicus TaxID=1912 RepID=UPI00099DCA55|nr:restriction endonuclease subunit S [Streptomyces hygroscopicus]